jgi:transcriptional/translational regulatory protein YebC/TACO1
MWRRRVGRRMLKSLKRMMRRRKWSMRCVLHLYSGSGANERSAWQVITSPTELSNIASTLSSSPLGRSLRILAVEQAYIPTTPVYLPGATNKPVESEEIGEEQAEKASYVLCALDEVADVQRVWTNVVGLDS